MLLLVDKLMPNQGDLEQYIESLMAYQEVYFPSYSWFIRLLEHHFFLVCSD